MDGQVLIMSLAFLTLLLLSIGNAGNPDPYAGGVSIQMINGCYGTVYPGVFTKEGPRVIPTGFKMEHLDVYDLKVPDLWSGTIWIRTACSGNPNRTFHCLVGDCGSNHIHCHTRTPRPPVTLMKFNLAAKGGGNSSYKLDLRYGLNLPVTITPLDNRCKYVACFTDLRFQCPDWLAVYDHDGGKLACKSACYTTAEPKDCCTGDYASPEKCQLNEYTQIVKKECPDAVTNAFDETHFSCFGGISFVIKFC